MSDCDCCTLIYESEGVKIVQRAGHTDYELVMPSGNRNIWFSPGNKEGAIYCASVVGSCWLEAEACGAIEERENGVVAHKNQALTTCLRELVEAAGFGDGLQMMLAGNPNVIERATARYHAAIATAHTLLNEEKKNR